MIRSRLCELYLFMCRTVQSLNNMLTNLKRTLSEAHQKDQLELVDQLYRAGFRGDELCELVFCFMSVKSVELD